MVKYRCEGGNHVDSWQPGDYKDFYQEYPYYRKREFFDRCLFPLSVRFLEVGCAEGMISKIMTLNCDVVGCDIDRDMLIRGRNAHPDQEFILCDACHLPFKLDSFDVVLCSEVIEHIRDVRQLLIEMKSIAEKIIITTPIRTLFAYSYKLLNPRYVAPDGHISVFTPRGWKHIIESCDMTTTYECSYGFAGYGFVGKFLKPHRRLEDIVRKLDKRFENGINLIFGTNIILVLTHEFTYRK